MLPHVQTKQKKLEKLIKPWAPVTRQFKETVVKVLKQELKQRLKQKNLQLNRLSRQYPIKLSKRSKNLWSNRLLRQYLIRGLEETKEGPDLRIGPSLAPRDRSRSKSRSKSADRKDKKAGGDKGRKSCRG